MSMYVFAQLIISVGMLALFGVAVYYVYQAIRVMKSYVWFQTTTDAYKVGMIKFHAKEHDIELCYEPTKEEKGLMQRLDDDVKRSIGE